MTDDDGPCRPVPPDRFSPQEKWIYRGGLSRYYAKFIAPGHDTRVGALENLVLAGSFAVVVLRKCFSPRNKV